MKVFLLLVCVASIGCSAHSTGLSVYAQLRQERMPLYNLQEDVPRESLVTPGLNRYQQMVRVYDAFDKEEAFVGRAPSSPVLATSAWRDLRLFRSDKPLRDASVFSALNRTITPFGAIYLQGMLASPTADLGVLRERQSRIKRLVTDDALYSELTIALTKLKPFLNTMLSFYRSGKERAFPWLWAHVSEGELVELQAELTKTAGAREAEAFISERRAQDKNALFKNLFRAWLHKATVDGMVLGLQGAALFSFLKAARAVVDAGHYSFFGEGRDHTPARKAGNFILPVLGVALAYPLFNAARKRYAHMRELFYVIKEKMQKTREFLEGAQGIVALAGKNHLLRVDAVGESNGNQLAQLFTLLTSDAVNSARWSGYFLTNGGKVLLAHDLVRQHSSGHIATILKDLGALDALVSIATLVRERQEESVGFCFPVYTDPRTVEGPGIALQEYWHPMIAPDKVVTNSVRLGGQEKHRHAVIMGPNGGGKSAAMNGIVLSVIMAQSLSIAPARSMDLTPFAYINTFMNIADDVTRGLSGFGAEVVRMEELGRTFSGLQEHEFVLCEMDELLRTTNPIEGQAASYSIARSLGERKGSMLLIATHFPIMSMLPETTNGLFKNYKVVAALNPISYPFTLQEGASVQKIALALLAEKGFESNGLLKYAYEKV